MNPDPRTPSEIAAGVQLTPEEVKARYEQPDQRLAGGLAKAGPQIPSICRMVTYHGHGHPEPAEWPAVVLRINPDGTLMLTVLTEKGPMQVASSEAGVGVNQWSWPLRSVGLSAFPPSRWAAADVAEDPPSSKDQAAGMGAGRISPPRPAEQR
jgi:hypothetical protein